MLVPWRQRFNHEFSELASIKLSLLFCIYLDGLVLTDLFVWNYFPVLYPSQLVVCLHDPCAFVEKLKWGLREEMRHYLITEESMAHRMNPSWSYLVLTHLSIYWGSKGMAWKIISLCIFRDIFFLKKNEASLIKCSLVITFHDFFF